LFCRVKPQARPFWLGFFCCAQRPKQRGRNPLQTDHGLVEHPCTEKTGEEIGTYESVIIRLLFLTPKTYKMIGQDANRRKNSVCSTRLSVHRRGEPMCSPINKLKLELQPQYRRHLAGLYLPVA